MKSKIQIYSVDKSEALSYTLGFIFDEFFGVTWELISDKSLLRAGEAFINYSEDKMEGGIQIVPYGNFIEIEFPFKEGVGQGRWNNLPVFFTTSGDLPFDIFAAIFFLLSRYEEYHISDRDTHGRFESKNSLLHKLNLLERPIVDEWLVALRDILKTEIQDFKPISKKFEWINTFDIDVAYAYTSRPFIRVVGATAKNLLKGDFKYIAERLKVFSGTTVDPFDTYRFQEGIARKYGCKTVYFFLVGGDTTYDNALDINHKGMRNLISQVGSYAEIGLHPSYNSGWNNQKLVNEKRALQNVTGEKVTSSRQHFLRLKIPATFEDLSEVGIQSDYSLGYAERIGFRSGTCTPHFFFNIHSKSRTRLKLYPLHIMDGSMRDYMKLLPTEAMEAQNKLIQRIKDVDGTFTSLWHNDTIRDGSEWQMVYSEMAKKAGTHV